ncbi:MAG: hypothetical protein V1781_07090 [Bacteroidota bacterium]
MDKRYNNHLDSIQIIIDRFFDRQWKWEVIALYKDKSGVWHGEMCITKTKGKGSNSYEECENYTLLPKKDWQSAIQKYYDLKFDTLPNMKDIKGSDFKVRDGVMNTFTYRHKEKSRRVEYQSPDLFKKKSWQTANATEILEIHQKYFVKKRN